MTTVSNITIDQIINKSANEIFETFSLQETQSISTQLSRNYQLKQDELRNLVSYKYRDLLTTADEIKSIEALSKESDLKLYQLSFDKNVQLEKIGIIERNIEKYGSITIDNENIENLLNDRFEKVIGNSDNFIKLSNFFNLNDDDEILYIFNKINEIDPLLKKNQSSKEKIFNKFKQIELILINKLNSLKDLNEINSIYKFFELNHVGYNFDFVTFKQILLNKLIQLIDNNDSLLKILETFTFYQKDILKHYTQLIDTKFNQIEQLDISTNDDTELKLYQLSINDDDYLHKIEYLNNGLIYSNYQKLNDLIHSIKSHLKLIKLIDSNHFDDYNNQLNTVIQNFSKQAEKTQNTSLIRYLQTI